MAVEYDLVILGGTAYARTAALRAARYGARVALVEPPGLFEQRQQQAYLLKGLQTLGETLQQQAVGDRFGLKRSGALNWQKILSWSAIAADTQQPSLAAEAMNASGVDVVLEAPQRLTRQLVVITETRRLGARSVIAAFGELPTFAETVAETFTKTLPSAQSLQSLQSLPQAVDIVGASAAAVEWALALSGCGIEVTLVADDVLPYADGDVQTLMRSRLIASGVQICSKSNHTLQIDIGKPVLDLPDFITLKTNRKLQTNHPRVFACGSILGGVTDEIVAQCEIAIALQNALFLPHATVNYERILQTYSQWAQIGLTEAQAQRRYGSLVARFTVSCTNVASLTTTRPMPSYCKLICIQRRLVGAHIVGRSAAEVGRLLSLKIGERLKESDISGEQNLLSLIATGLEQSARPSAQDSSRLHNTRWQPGCWRRDWAENWFNWRRSRT